MKPTRLASALAALFLAAAFAAPLAAPAADVDATGAVPGRWTHDYAAAAALARAQNLPLLLDFTGSDWCIWCKRMDAQVFSSDAWAAVAPHFALAFIDFPSDASFLPAGAIGRNRQLAQIHRVQGYPTFVLLAPDGTPLLKTGTDLDPDSFIATLRDALPDDLAFVKPNAAAPDTDEPAPDTAPDAEAAEPPDADADIDPFDLPADLEVTQPEPPTNVVAIIDIRTCAAVIEKYLPASLLDQFPVAGAQGVLKDADPQARFVVLLDAEHLAPVISGSISGSLAFYDADAPDAFLAALSDDGWATDDTAELPTDAPQGLLALANANGFRLYVLRQDNTLFIDDILPLLLRNLELADDLPALLPAEGEIVCQVRPALLNVLPGIDLAPLLGQLDAVTFGTYLEKGDLHVQVHMETAPGSDIQALAAACRPAPAEASCVLLPGALLTSVSGASTDALAVQRLGTTMADTLGKLLGGPSDDDLQSYLQRGAVATSMAVFPPVADPGKADAPATPSVLYYYAGTHAIRSVPNADLPVNPIPAPDAAQTYRDIPVSAYDLPLADIKEDLAMQFPRPVDWLVDQAIPDSVRIRVARLPKGLLFATGPDDLLHAAIDAALDASAPAPDQTPEFQAAFPYPDAPALGTFHLDLGALLASYFPGFDPAEAQKRLHPSICENTIPDFAHAAPGAPALIDTFSYALAENSYVTRFNFALPSLAEIWTGFFNWAQVMSSEGSSGSIVQAPWNGYTNAYILSNATVCAVVVPELGRMTFLSTSLDAPNLLRFDASLAGSLPTPDTPFFNIGGDWLWPVPQDAWPLLPGSNGADWPPPPALADAPDAWTVSSTNGGLTLTRTYPAPVSCTVARRFILPPNANLHVIQNLMVNTAETEATDQPAIPHALWQVAQIPLPDSIAFDVHPKDSAYPDGVHIIAGEPTFADNGENGLTYAPSEGGEAKFGADGASSLGAQGPGPQGLRLDMVGTAALPGADSIQCYVNHGLGYAELETLGRPSVDTDSMANIAINIVQYRFVPSAPSPDVADDAEPPAEDTAAADVPANIAAPAEDALPK